jgi:hypothetical protein
MKSSKLREIPRAKLTVVPAALDDNPAGVPESARDTKRAEVICD